MGKIWGSIAAALDDRQSNRNYISFAAVLRTGPIAHDVVVHNISAHGVMVEITGTLVPGRPVTIEADALAATSGRVAWTRDGHAGIAFDEPLSLETLLAVV